MALGWFTHPRSVGTKFSFRILLNDESGALQLLSLPWLSQDPGQTGASSGGSWPNLTREDKGKAYLSRQAAQWGNQSEWSVSREISRLKSTNEQSGSWEDTGMCLVQQWLNITTSSRSMRITSWPFLASCSLKSQQLCLLLRLLLLSEFCMGLLPISHLPNTLLGCTWPFPAHPHQLQLPQPPKFPTLDPSGPEGSNVPSQVPGSY